MATPNPAVNSRSGFDLTSAKSRRDDRHPVVRPRPARYRSSRWWLRSARRAVIRARVDIGARAFCIIAGFALTIAGGTHRPTDPAAVGLLLSFAAGAMVCWVVIEGHTRTYHWALVAEGSFAIALVTLTSATFNSEAYVIYIAAPPLLAGLRSGLVGVVSVVGAEAGTLVALQVHRFGSVGNVVPVTGPWLLTGLATGVLGAWIRELRLTVRENATSPYASAHRLLGQLRTITRELPGGLDIEAVSEEVLTRTLETLNGRRVALLLLDESSRPVVVATRGEEPSIVADIQDSTIGESIRHRQPVQAALVSGRPSCRFRACIPLLVGLRVIGAVVVDGPESLPSELLDEYQVRLDDDALRIESAVLFTEVRAGATVEERRRLAREIHDGIAQEIGALGYLVDDLARDQCDQGHQADLVLLRTELTRVVTELRLSIFDLRSGVTTNAGLGSVLADYVREVGRGSGMTVHVSLEESPTRLRIDVETELLRIAQEAVQNARKHSKASNLWVVCRVEPPFAEIRIDDDGIGSAAPRDEHYGFHIMHERAKRVNAVLSIHDRPGGGTSVSAVVVPTPTDASELTATSGGRHALHRATHR